MANYLKFPTFTQHNRAFQYASDHSGGESSDYEPDGDNGPVGWARYDSFRKNPSKMPKTLSSKYTYYIARANQAGKILKF